MNSNDRLPLTLNDLSVDFTNYLADLSIQTENLTSQNKKIRFRTAYINKFGSSVIGYFLPSEMSFQHNLNFGQTDQLNTNELIKKLSKLKNVELEIESESDNSDCSFDSDIVDVEKEYSDIISNNEVDENDEDNEVDENDEDNEVDENDEDNEVDENDENIFYSCYIYEYGKGYIVKPPEEHPDYGDKYYTDGCDNVIWWKDSKKGWFFKKEYLQNVINHGGILASCSTQFTGFADCQITKYGKGYIIKPAENHPDYGTKYYTDGEGNTIWWHANNQAWFCKKEYINNVINHGGVLTVVQNSETIV